MKQKTQSLPLPNKKPAPKIDRDNLSENGKELVLIPVNNPNFHWSLLVYEVKNKKFYHWDTLKGVNWDYAKPLCEELLKFLPENWQSPNYQIKQRNGWDCGVATINVI